MHRLSVEEKNYFLTKSFVREWLKTNNILPQENESEFNYRKRVFPVVCKKLDRAEGLEFLFGVERSDKLAETEHGTYNMLFAQFSVDLANVSDNPVKYEECAKKIAKGFHDVDPMDQLYHKE